jgi:hypothetical protein
MNNLDENIGCSVSTAFELPSQMAQNAINYLTF